MTNQNNAAQAANQDQVAALQDLRHGVEMNRAYLDDGDIKLAALDAAIDVLSKLRAPVADARAAMNLPTMRSAFRITEQHGDPDPAKRQYNMVFKFRSIEALDAADDEWRAALASAPDFAEAYAGAREDLAIWKRRALEAERDLRAERETSSRLVAELNAQNGPTHMGEPGALASAPVAGEAQHDTDSVCAWQVWWNQNKSRFTTTRQASFAAFAAAKDWRYAAPQASADAVLDAVQVVLKAFKADEAQGYHTRDRQFAISILEQALSSPQASAEYERGHADGWCVGLDQAMANKGGQQRAGDVGDREAWAADMVAAGAKHLGDECREWESDDFLFHLWQVATGRQYRAARADTDKKEM